jgi:hypothetical protein
LSIKASLITLFYILRLSFQSLGLLTQTKLKHRKAKVTFEKTLIHQGISLETAQELAKAYPDPLLDLVNLIKLNVA